MLDFMGCVMEWTKILVANMQVFTSFTVNFPIAWPNFLISAAASLQFANLDLMSLSGACANDLYFYDVMVMQLTGPLIVVSIIMSSAYIQYLRSAKKIEGFLNALTK